MAGIITASDIKFASIDATADGDNTVVAAVAAKKIRVLGFIISQTAIGVTIWKSGAATTLSTNSLLAQTPADFVGDSDCPAFETAIGQALVINNAAGVDTKGSLTYVLLDASNAPA